MKQGIHPEYGPATVKCACGNEFETRSTKKELRARSAIRSLPASRSWSIPADVLTALTDGFSRAANKSGISTTASAF